MNAADYWKGYDNYDVTMDAAKKIWKTFRKQITDDKSFADLIPQKKLDIYQDRFSKFHRQFPIVFRYMIYYKKFYVKAFDRFLTKLHKIPTTSMDEKIHRQAEYVAKYLYRESCKYSREQYSAQAANKMQSEIEQTLKEEKASFEDKHKAEQEEVKRCIKLNDIEKRENLIKFLQKQQQMKKDGIMGMSSFKLCNS